MMCSQRQWIWVAWERGLDSNEFCMPQEVHWIVEIGSSAKTHNHCAHSSVCLSVELKSPVRNELAVDLIKLLIRIWSWTQSLVDMIRLPEEKEWSQNPRNPKRSHFGTEPFIKLATSMQITTLHQLVYPINQTFSPSNFLPTSHHPFSSHHYLGKSQERKRIDYRVNWGERG